MRCSYTTAREHKAIVSHAVFQAKDRCGNVRRVIRDVLHSHEVHPSAACNNKKQLTRSTPSLAELVFAALVAACTMASRRVARRPPGLASRTGFRDAYYKEVQQGAGVSRAWHLCSSLASQGVLVSVMLPLRISLPIMSAAALGAAAPASAAKPLQLTSWLQGTLLRLSLNSACPTTSTRLLAASHLHCLLPLHLQKKIPCHYVAAGEYSTCAPRNMIRLEGSLNVKEWIHRNMWL